MSAYIVSRDHIQYLVSAAMSNQIRGRHSHSFRWFHGGESHELVCTDFAKAAEVGQMLWDECVASVKARYPNESTDTLPGPISEDYQYDTHKRHFAETFEPVQVIKAIHCYEYQSCEHGGWESSEACSFVRTLASLATTQLDGYDDAEWGSPVRRTAAV